MTNQTNEYYQSQPEFEERESMMDKFIVYKPTGNNTGLIINPNAMSLDPDIRKIMNDAIMASDDTIEQVGFVNLTGPIIQLVMAGGEFCGNATRSAAYCALDGKPGEVLIQVSGIKRLLKAGVTPEGYAYAEMPIRSNITIIDKNNIIVPLDGITQLISFSADDVTQLSEEELKKQAFQILEKNALTDCAAAGVIYAEKLNNDAWKITPIIYVASIQTLFIETACGSGTIALTQALSYLGKKSIDNLSVLQPSGMTIYSSVAFNGKKGFSNGFISGPVKELYRGVIDEKEGTVETDADI